VAPPTKRAWLLNLDAEEELRHPGAVNPSRAMIDRCARMASKLTALCAPGDLAWTPGAPLPDARGMIARAWCPTPGALRTLARAGAVLTDVPSWEVLRAANHRSFSSSLAQPLPGAAYVGERSSLEALISTGSCTGVWRLKRPLGYRGGGTLRVRGRTLDERTRQWAAVSFERDGGLQVEPEVERLEDHGLHGHLSREGAVTFGVLTRQRVDAFGAWESTERIGDASLSDDERRASNDVRTRVVDGLRAMGYWGPFGIDAFRWRDPSGAVRYCALCEVNARYSMGWPVGMEGRRVDLDGP
jgi:hypothetical protein